MSRLAELHTVPAYMPERERETIYQEACVPSLYGRFDRPYAELLRELDLLEARGPITWRGLP